MLKLLSFIPAILIGSMPAQAGHVYHGPYPSFYPGSHFACGPYGCFFTYTPRRQPIRINEHCVYKPWKDKTVCKY